MVLDGADIKYLLEKKGHTMRDVAEAVGVTPSAVCYTIWGQTQSRRITNRIETLLGMEPGTLEISKEKRDALIGAA
jgi:predicted transcriptional regulator